MSNQIVRMDCPTCLSPLCVDHDRESSFYKCFSCSQFFEIVEERSASEHFEFFAVSDEDDSVQRTGNWAALWIVMAFVVIVCVTAGTLQFNHAIGYRPIRRPTNYGEYSFRPRPDENISRRLLNIDPAESSRIRFVNLSNTNCHDEDLDAILGWHQVEELDVSGTKVTDIGIQKICENLHQLKRLRVARTLITDNGLEEIGSLTNLELLDLSGTPITDDGLERLQNCQELKYLYVANTVVSDAGAEQLKELRNLQTLCVRQTFITIDGLNQLLNLPNFELIIVGKQNIGYPIRLGDDGELEDSGISSIRDPVD